jgi:hypothetical protein
MIDTLLQPDLFIHDSTRALLAPLVSLFSAVMQSGELSVTLANQARVFGEPAALTLIDAEKGRAEEIRTACRDALTFAEQMMSGQIAVSSADLLALARQAAEGCEARKQEDIQTWADRLARDVGHVAD